MTQLEVASSVAPALAALVGKHRTGASTVRVADTRPAPLVGERGNLSGDAA